MKPMLKMAQQLIGYLIFGLVIAIIMSPSLFWLKKSAHVQRVWIAFDIFIATIAHGTWRRTVSGLTGQRAKTIPRYQYQETVIDHLAKFVGDEPNHCLRAYHWEIDEGVVS